MEIDTIMADKLLKRSKNDPKAFEIGSNRAEKKRRGQVRGAAELGLAAFNDAKFVHNGGRTMAALGDASVVGGVALGLTGFGSLLGLGVSTAGMALVNAGVKRKDRGRAGMETGKMIARQGDNVARSPRMAETLSMASMETGVRGPQSNPRDGEAAAGFAAANAKFAGSRGSTASKQAKGPRADQPKSDGYVEAHTRRQGTKSVQVKQRRMSGAELRKR